MTHFVCKTSPIKLLCQLNCYMTIYIFTLRDWLVCSSCIMRQTRKRKLWNYFCVIICIRKLAILFEKCNNVRARYGSDYDWWDNRFRLQLYHNCNCDWSQKSQLHFNYAPLWQFHQSLGICVIVTVIKSLAASVIVIVILPRHETKVW